MDTSGDSASLIPVQSSSSSSSYKDGGAYEGTTKVRRSLREIKKPKFDDEIVDSSATMKALTRKRTMHHSPDTSDLPLVGRHGFGALVLEKTENGCLASKLGSTRKRPRVSDASTGSTTANEEKQTKKIAQLPSPVLPFDKKRRDRIASKEARTKELAAAASQNTAASASVLESLKKWTATDDLALIVAVTHTSSLKAVRAGVTFSRSFSLSEIEERWYELLYDEAVSSIARRRMQDLPVETIKAIQSKTVFTVKEEQLLARVPSTAPNQLSTFEQLLRDNRRSLHEARTAEVLLEHWRQMRLWHLLADQTGTPPHLLAALGSCQLTLLEKSNADACLAGDWQLTLETSRVAANIQRIDRKLSHFSGHMQPRVRVEAVSGVWNEAQMGDGVWAVLKGRVMRYEVRSKRVLIGRSTAKHEVDVNLALEGPAARISRKQALLKCCLMNENGTSAEETPSELDKQLYVKTPIDGPSASSSNSSITEPLVLKGTRTGACYDTMRVPHRPGTRTLQFVVINVGKRAMFVDGKVVLEGHKAVVSNNSVIEVAHVRLILVTNTNMMLATATASNIIANNNNIVHNVNVNTNGLC